MELKVNGDLVANEWIEEEFSMKIPPQDLTIENFESVQAIANYLQQAKVS